MGGEKIAIDTATSIVTSVAIGQIKMIIKFKQLGRIQSIIDDLSKSKKFIINKPYSQ